MKKYKKTSESKNETIEVREDFMPFGMKQLDSKDRISLGGKLKKIISEKMDMEGFQVFLGADGDILLRPTVAIPAREAWIFKDPGVIGGIRQGLDDVKHGRVVKVDNLEEFLKKL
jgi:hypothetical protein